MTVFGTRRTGNCAIILDECVNPGRPEHHLLIQDPPVTYAVAEPGKTKVYARNSFILVHIFLILADLRMLLASEVILACVKVSLCTSFM